MGDTDIFGIDPSVVIDDFGDNNLSVTRFRELINASINQISENNQNITSTKTATLTGDVTGTVMYHLDSDDFSLETSLDTEVATQHIADGAVTTDKLAGSSVTTAKIAAQAVTTTELADNSVTTAKIVDGAVTAAKVDTDADLRVRTITVDSSTALTPVGPAVIWGDDNDTGVGGRGGQVRFYTNAFERWRIGDEGLVAFSNADIRNSDGSVSDPSYSFADDTNTGFYRDFSTGNIGVSIDGTNVATFSSSGLMADIAAGDGSIDTAELADGAVTAPKVFPEFATNTAYDSEDMVQFDGELFQALVDIPATNTDNPSDGTTWRQIGGGIIEDGTIIPAQLNSTNDPAADQVLRASADGTQFTWVDPPGDAFVTKHNIISVDGVTQTFTTTISNAHLLFVDGIALHINEDYSFSGNTVTLVSAIEDGLDIELVNFNAAGAVAGILSKTTLTSVANQTVYTVPNSGVLSAAHNIIISGLTLVEGIDYTVSADRTQFTLTSAVAANLDIELQTFAISEVLGDNEINGSVLIDNTVTQAKLANDSVGVDQIQLGTWSFSVDSTGNLVLSNSTNGAVFQFDLDGHFNAEDDITAFTDI